NRLINAIKSPEGGRIEVPSRNSPDGELRVTVTDTGVGMDDQTVEALFLPFEQRPASKTGLGLGLAICKGIVDAHQGQIWASSPGQGWGSIFEVDLPVADGEEVTNGRAAAADGRAAAGDGRAAAAVRRVRRILLVEDDPDSSETLKLILLSEGHEVAVAKTVADALEKGRDGWDVVISDLALPDGSGLD